MTAEGHIHAIVVVLEAATIMDKWVEYCHPENTGNVRHAAKSCLATITEMSVGHTPIDYVTQHDIFPSWWHVPKGRPLPHPWSFVGLLLRLLVRFRPFS